MFWVTESCGETIKTFNFDNCISAKWNKETITDFFSVVSVCRTTKYISDNDKHLL